MPVHPEPLPPEALLQRHTNDPDNYTDCFVKEVLGTVTLADFLAAFYTTPLFRLEHLILRVALRKRCINSDPRDLTNGQSTAFAAWTIEDRDKDQILLCDLLGGTHSWFMVAATEHGTRLYFGSAVTPATGIFVRLLMPFHKVYARALLASTKPRPPAPIT